MEQFHISQFFNLPEDADLDFFDANLVYDSPVFIDSFLLKNSPVPYEVELFERFGDYFSFAYDKSLEMGIGHYTQAQLKKLLTFHGPKNINMGYTEKSNEGHGPSLAERLLSFFVDASARRFVIETDAFPEHKYNPVSIQAFTSGIGFDGLSDITANLIMDYLIKYTREQSRIWGIPLEPRMALDIDGFDFDEMAWRKTKTGMTPKIEPVIGRTMRSMGNMLSRMYRDVTFLPESETGNGLVDFRLIYKDCTIVIEIKLLKNNTKKGAEQLPAYIHGIKIQLPHYAELTEAKYAYYVTGLHHNGVYDSKKNDLPRLNEVVNAREAVEIKLKTKLPNFQELIHVNVDMVPRGSASDL
jgi:hypothetical protein